MTALLQAVVDAAALGSLYALYALGVALIFGVSGIMNFAYGNFIAVGAYALLIVGSLAWPLAALLVVAMTVLLGLAVELAAFRPARARRADSVTVLIVAFAIGIGLENAIMIGAGARPLGTAFGAALSRNLDLGGVSVAAGNLVTIGVVGLVLAALVVLLRATTLGRQLRAAAIDPMMLRMLGVSADRVVLLTVGISAALAGIAALMLVVQTGSLSLGMGVQPVLIAFIATVLGGLGSLAGATVAAFFLAAVTVAIQELLPGAVLPYRTAILFLVVILVLLARPSGLITVVGRGARI